MNRLFVDQSVLKGTVAALLLLTGLGTPAFAQSNGRTTGGDTAARKPFQARVAVNPTADGFLTVLMPIPAGKRLVIENVSAIARSPEGMRMEINFYTYMDSNGDGVGDLADITFHRIALTEQGTFGGTAIAAANHKVLVFADELIGTSHFQVAVQARLNGSTSGFAQGQVTFTGYVEDLPAAP